MNRIRWPEPQEHDENYDPDDDRDWDDHHEEVVLRKEGLWYD